MTDWDGKGSDDMSKDGYQLTSDAVRLYEEQKVPAVFGPLARATLAVHAVAPDDVVLDVACGTGIVTRTIRDLFGSQPNVLGIDLNDGMIATARQVCALDGVVADFRVCDATATGLDEGAFTFVICQQGLQFFPDEAAALAEWRRVAAVGGRIVATVWSAPSPLFAAIADALRAHVGPDVADLSLAPFSWAGAGTIVGRMSAAGFADVSLDEVEVERVLAEPEVAVPKEILGSAVGSSVAAMGPTALDSIVAEVLDATSHYRRGDHLVIPQRSHLISALAT